MKCPRCWAEKAYAHPMGGWKGVLLDCLLLTRMKCHHCYHKFVIPWFFTLGKQVTPPARSPSSRSGGSPPSINIAQSRRGVRSGHASGHREHRRKADAA